MIITKKVRIIICCYKLIDRIFNQRHKLTRNNKNLVISGSNNYFNKISTWISKTMCYNTKINCTKKIET